MNIFGTSFKKLPAILGAGLLVALLPSCKKAVTTAPKAAATPAAKNTATNATITTNLGDPFLSTFDGSPPPGNTGRDPFFPNSIRRIPVNVKISTPAAAPHVESALKLGSVTGNKSGQRYAVINSRYLLAVGQEADVSTPNGKVHVKVIEIGEDYAVVNIEGEGQKRLDLHPNTRSP